MPHNSFVKFLTDGPDQADTVIALAHGAGSGMDTPFMTAIARGLAGLGLRVVRFEFPYMEKRRDDGKRRGPDPARLLIATWNEVIAELTPERLVIAGKSMGGRIASMVADDARVRGLVCLGYPFHPPGQPEKKRTAHLETLTTPTLILQGTRDPFGTPEDVESYALSPAIRVEWIEDGDHSFKPRVKSGRTLEQNIATAIDQAAGFVRGLRLAQNP
jgi:hypothetical protein